MPISKEPIRFVTQFKDKIWGGSKIRDVLGKDFAPLPNCGETWELSGVDGNISVVSDGPYKDRSLNDLVEEFTIELLGTKVYQKYGTDFPLLIKFIDAQDDLSIQVHPDDAAAEKFGSFGKTEMWYVIDAEPNARLVSGLIESVKREQYTEALKSGDFNDILKWTPVYADDVFFIPAGKVHSIGKGILLAEIQQSSDITFRIYDFDRTDDYGNKRELHNEEAVDVIDFEIEQEPKTSYVDKLNEPVEIVSNDFFTTQKLIVDQKTIIDLIHDSFTILICLEGEAEINGHQIRMGEVVLLPAVVERLDLDPSSKATLLEVFIQ